MLWLVAAPLEALADRQLKRFKADPANKGRTMRYGLWRYSRHPNYFFQWLTWVAYALIALSAPYGWIGLVSPLLILYLILFVTGVKPAEEQALRSRGDDFRRYQRETSVFIPWLRGRRRPDRVRARPGLAAATRGIRANLAARLARERRKGSATREFIERLRASPIAEQVERANEQHYELPAEFFELVLGPRLKYSSCLWAPGDTLAAAEERMLALTCERARSRTG